jgi:hypothetical protein
MTSAKKLHAFKTRHWPWHGTKRKDVINAAQIRFRRHHARSQQSFDL